jgi:hypothetical protein
MKNHPIHLDTHNRISELELHIEELQQQRNIIQNIESFVSDYRLDFADLIDTNALLNEEIERYQRQIHQLVVYENIIGAE